MKKVKIVQQNRLPHIRPVGATFFITINLADALPRYVIKDLQQAFEQEKIHIQKTNPTNAKQLIYEAQKRYFGKYDHQLDSKPYGECYLSRSEVADVVVNKLEAMNGQYFDLQAYCIMPNHIHFLADTSIQLHRTDIIIDELNLDEHYTQLDEILRLFKGNTSFYANRAIGRSGSFWQKDSYDHFVRDEREWDNIAHYILQNPVKAGLVTHSEDWEYSYYKYA